MSVTLFQVNLSEGTTRLFEAAGISWHSFEKGLDPDDGVRLRFRLVLQMVHPRRTPYIRIGVQHIKAVVGAGIDLQGDLGRRLFLRHLFNASTGGCPIVRLPDQDQEGRIEAGQRPSAGGIKGDGGAKWIIRLSI